MKVPEGTTFYIGGSRYGKDLPDGDDVPDALIAQLKADPDCPPTHPLLAAAPPPPKPDKGK